MNTPNWQNLRRNVWEMLLRRWLADHPVLTADQMRRVEIFKSALARHDSGHSFHSRWETNGQLNATLSQLMES